MQTRPAKPQIVYSAPPEPPPPHPAWGLAIIAALLAALFGAAYGALWLWTITGPRLATVPNLIGVEESAARQILERRGLKGDVVARQAHERRPAGIVLSTFPGPNSRVKQGRSVEIIVSSGSGWARVPDVGEMSLERARARIEAAGLRIGRQRRLATRDVPEGYIASQRPRAGERVRRGSNVDLSISSRREASVKYARVGVSLPGGEGATHVRIEVHDDEGDRVAYEGDHPAGSDFARTVVGTGEMTVKVYADDELIQEKSF